MRLTLFLVEYKTVNGFLGTGGTRTMNQKIYILVWVIYYMLVWKWEVTRNIYILPTSILVSKEV